jgi:MFS family permease
VLVCALLVSGTILGTAGTDLVLPAVPALPEALDGTEALAQLVLAAFAAGTACGLLLFGALGARVDQRTLLLVSLAAYAAASLVAALAPDLRVLVGLRFVQGLTSAAPAVFAPGMIRALFDEQGALRAMGLLGSIESLTPAFAPVLGAWLLTFADWRASFVLLGVLSVALVAAIALQRHRFPAQRDDARHVGWLTLLVHLPYLRYALSQAGILGALLVFVFGAPAVIVGSLGGELSDFVVMQVAGISTFIVAANLAGHVALRVGPEATIAAGSLLSCTGALALLVYAVTGGADPALLPWLFVPMNMGLGLRGPPGFLRAIQAGLGDDARASALVILFVLGIAAGGTAVVAPFITDGLLPLTATAATLSVAGCLVLLLPRLEQAP